MTQGIGGVLEIPDDLTSKLDNIDKKLERIANSSENMANNFDKSLSSISEGFNPVISSIDKLNISLNNLDLSKLSGGFENTASSTKVLNSELENTSQKAKKVADSIAKVTTEFSKAPNVKKPILGDTDESINSIKSLEQELKKLKQYAGDIDLGKDLSDRGELEQTIRKIQTIDATIKNLKKTASVTTKIDVNKTLGMPENTINQRIAKVKELQRAQKDLDTTTKEGASANDNLNSSIRRLNTENTKAVAGSKELQLSHRRLMDTAGQLARRLALIFSVSQITGYINNIIRVRGEFELQNRALQAILQNKAEADKLFGQITALAVRSPFQLKELVTYTKQLAAYRIETERLYGTTKMLADVSAGIGIDMQRLILAFGQVKAANYLRGQELRQFSEGGINILGELATYFTELNGKIVTTGDVFEMVSKRMVTFGDVEKIFEKLTSEGGIFYNMQEIQAETLLGQISNLKDTLDITFNEIGKANDGVLKDTVAFVRSIIENWQVLEKTIKGLLIAFISYKVYAMGAKLANIQLAESMGIVAVGATKQLSVMQLLTLGWKSFTKGIKTATVALKTFALSNAWILALMGIISAISSVVTWNDKYNDSVKDINTKLNEQKKILNDIAYSYNKIDVKDNANGYNEKIKEFKKLKDYIEESKINIPIDLEKIKPEDIDNAFNDVKETIIEIKDFGAEVSKAVAEGFAGKEGNVFGIKLLGENLESDLQDLDDAYGEISGGVKSQLVSVIDEIANKYDVLPQMARKYYDEIKKGIGEEETEEQFLYRKIKLVADIRDIIYMTGNEQLESTKTITELESKRLNILTQEKEVRHELNKVIKRLTKSYGVKDFANLPENVKANLQVEIDKAFEQTQLSEQSKRMAAYWIAHPIGIPYKLNPDKSGTESELSWLGGQINNFINKNQLNVSLVKTDDTTESYFKTLKDDSASLLSDINKLKNATTPLYKGISNKEKIAELKKQYDAQRKVLRVFGELEEKTQKDPMEQVWKTRIELLKRANSEYEKLNKVLSKTEAIDKVNKLMSNEFKASGLTNKGGALKYRIDFDKQATLYNINTMAQEAGSAYSKDFEKEISPMETDLFINAKLIDVDIVKRGLEEAFSGYEIGLQIEEMGIPKNFLENIFGVKSINFDELTKKINETIRKARTYRDEVTGKDIYVETEDETISRVKKENSRKTENEITEMLKVELAKRAELEKNLSDENISISLDAEKKKRSIIESTANSRAKKYAQLITDAMTTEAKISKIESDGAKEREEIRKDFEGVDDSYMNQLLDASQNKENELIAQLRESSFKATEIYKEMFGDIQSYGEYTVNYLLNKAKEMTQSFNNGSGLGAEFIKSDTGEDKVKLSYRDENNEIKSSIVSMETYLKVLKQITKLQEEKGKGSLFPNLSTQWAKFKEVADERKRLYKDNTSTAEDMAKAESNYWKSLSEVIESTGTDVINLTENYKFLSDIVGESGKKAIKTMAALGKSIVAVVGAISTAEKKGSAILAIIQAILVVIQAITDVIGTKSSKADDKIEILTSAFQQLEYWQNRVTMQSFVNEGELNVLKKELALRKQIYQQIYTNLTLLKQATEKDTGANIKNALVGIQGMLTQTMGAGSMVFNAIKGAITGNFKKLGQTVLNSFTGGAVAVYKLFENAAAKKNIKKGIAYVNSELEYMQKLTDIIESNFNDMQKSVLALGLSYEKEITNLDAQIAAEQDRKAKNVDWDKIRDLQNQKLELMQKNALKWAESIKQNYGDIFEELSDGISQALLDAFKNSTDPAEAFAESWDDAITSFIMNMYKIQVLQPRLKKFMGQLNQSLGLNADGTAKTDAAGGEITPDMYIDVGEAKALKESYNDFESEALQGYNQLTDLLKALGVKTEKDMELSGLQKGIQGVTEDTAQALEALLNTIRFFISDNNSILKGLYNAFTSQDTRINPILAELKAQTEQMRLINDFLTSVGRPGHTKGGQGIKVFID